MGKTIFMNFLLLVSFLCADAQSDSRKANYNLSKSQLAIKGYDPVAYFTQGKPVEGNSAFSYIQDGVTYYFSSSQNRESFKQDPARYEPQYGGWCAYAMGKTGEKIEVDPETFKIVNGKLFLFYNKYFNNTLKFWNKDEADLKNNADLNWKKINK
jgi:YHS domain-containing protein